MSAAGGALRPYALRCEHRTTPLGIGERSPLLAWRLVAADTARRGVAQAAYRLQVTPDSGGPPVWDTGKVADTKATGVVYAGPPLRPRTRYRWQVTVWTADQADETAGRAESWFETALDATGWRSSWIAHDWTAVEVADPPEEGDRGVDAHGLRPCPMLRRAFSVQTAPVRARLYVSARGLYEMRVNGDRVGDAELAPGWTDYRHRVQYQTYDVTALRRPAARTSSPRRSPTAGGAASSGSTPAGPARHYGTLPAADRRAPPRPRRRLHPRSSAPTRRWRTTTGATRYADLLMGECHDLRHAIAGWDRPGFDDSAWPAARVADDEPPVLVASVDEPVRAPRRAAPRWRSPGSARRAHRRLRAELRRAGPARPPGICGPGSGSSSGTARRSTSTARLYTANLRTAAATDVLIADGGADGGVRAALHLPRLPLRRGQRPRRRWTRATSRGVVLHSDTPLAGTFDVLRPGHPPAARTTSSGASAATSSACRPTARSATSGSAGSPTRRCSCPPPPQRRRRGLLHQVAARRATTRSTPDGGFTNVAPRLAGVADEGAPGWADAGCSCPGTCTGRTATSGSSRAPCDGMCAWVDLVHRHNPDLIWRHRVGPHFADWLALGPPTPREVVATAYFAHSAGLTARGRRVLGRDDDARAATRPLAARIRAAFVARFVGAGRTGRGRHPDRLPARARVRPAARAPGRGAAARLAELVEAAGPALTTGFLGVACSPGARRARARRPGARAAAPRRDAPSWLFPLRHGATTDLGALGRLDARARLPGPVDELLQPLRARLGRRVAVPRRRRSGPERRTPSATGGCAIRPRPGALTHARAPLRVGARPRRGRLASATGGALACDVQVPPGATADVLVPTSDPRSVPASATRRPRAATTSP